MTRIRWSTDSRGLLACLLLLVSSSFLSLPASHALATAATSPLTTAQPPLTSPSNASVDWSNLNAATLSALDVHLFLTANSSDLSQIPSAACSGFRSQQLTFLNATVNQCSGFLPECFANITSNAMSGLTSQCIHQLLPAVMGSVSAEQWSNTTAIIWKAVTQIQLLAMTTSCSGLTAEMVSYLGSSDMFDQTCAGITVSCMLSLNASSLSMLQQPCSTEMTTDVMHALTAAQINQMTPYSIAGLTQLQIAALTPSSCAGFTALQLSQLGLNNACPGFAASCIAALTPSACSGLTRDCVGLFTPAALSLVNSTQFASISAISLQSISAATLAGLNPAACSGMTLQQLTNLQELIVENKCQGLASACAQMIPSSVMPGLRYDCVAGMQPETFATFNRSQIFNISAAAFTYLTAAELKLMTSDACSGFHGDQFSYWSDSICSNFTSTCTAVLNASVWSNLDRDCFSILPVAAVEVIGNQQFASLLPSTLMGMTSAQLSVIHAQCSVFTAAQMAALGLFAVSTCSGMQSDCAQNLPLPAVFAMSASCLSSMSDAAVCSMSLNQLQAFNASTLAGMTWPHLSQLWTTYGVAVIDAWNVNQANSLLPATIANFAVAIDNGTIPTETAWTATTDLTQQSALLLANCNGTCMNALFATVNSVSLLPVLSWLGLRASHVAAIGEYGLSLTYLNNTAVWQMWSASALYALSADQTPQIPLNCINAFNLSSLSGAGITGLTDMQIRSIDEESLKDLICNLFHALTVDQQTILQQLYPKAYGARCAYCGAPNNPGNDDGGPLGIIAFVLIGAGCGVVLIGFFVWLSRKCSRKSNYDLSLDKALLQNE